MERLTSNNTVGFEQDLTSHEQVLADQLSAIQRIRRALQPQPIVFQPYLPGFEPGNVRSTYNWVNDWNRLVTSLNGVRYEGETAQN